MERETLSYRIKISGLVQGVGFRPFVYRIAKECGVFGTVDNRSDGVSIVAEGDPGMLLSFVEELKRQKPLASQIDEFTVSEGSYVGHTSFEIIKSSEGENQQDITEVSPDIAVCDACLEDMKTQANRKNYAFTNCTNCGPRFTIIKSLPYDRDKTCMEPFEMCEACKKEYTNVWDRRFHAQPVACNDCGPLYSLSVSVESGESTSDECDHLRIASAIKKCESGDSASVSLESGECNHLRIASVVKESDDIEVILERVSGLLEDGKLVAIKGLGGFHLVCSAHHEEAVARLRMQKHREGKPMAIMMKDIAKVKEYALVSDKEEELLTSWRRPIVLLKQKDVLHKEGEEMKEHKHYNSSFAPSVAIGFSSIGVMLPYMPFHHLLFERLKLDALVMTSGNISDEPILIDNEKAKQEFEGIADALITYNRDIHNRTDDSVAYVVNEQERLIRRSRSYAPSPIRLKLNTENIFAAGAELVNTFCIGRGNQAILSQHIGDLKNAPTLEFYEESIGRYTEMFRLKPEVIVHDLHPDYLSSQYALSREENKLAVQHHHAHIASCMAEHGLDEKVIGIALDGTGLGTDSKIWGGEFLITDLSEFERYTHFDYRPLPGGDKVTKQPWRTAVSYLYAIYGKDLLKLDLDFVKAIPEADLNFILQMLDKKLNCPESSSAGRLFDAVSALINLCPVASFHAEAPMRLEDVIDPEVKDVYPFKFEKTVIFDPMIEAIVKDLKQGISKGVLSAKFHNTLVRVVEMVVQKVHKEHGLKKVVLSGGSFQNQFLSKHIEDRLSALGFEVFAHHKVPANDGGIALGQLAIAASLRQAKGEA